MRILFVSEAAGGLGGVEHTNGEILRGLTDLGCEVALLRPGRRQPAADYAGTACVHALDKSALEGERGSLSHCIEDFKPHVVHVTGARWPLVSRVDAVVRKIPWVLTFHNLPTLEVPSGRFYGLNGLYYLTRNTRMLPNTLLWLFGLNRWRFARAICHSRQMQLRLVILGCHRERIILTPFGFSSASTSLDPPAGGSSPFSASSRPRLVTIAGIVHHKGIHDSLRAVAKLAEIFPQFSYVIIGGKRDEGYAFYLEGLAARLGIRSHVRFVYDASEETKWAALTDADLYIQPSHEEGFCLAFLDAAMTVPRLLGTATGEMPFIAEADPSSAIVTPKDMRDLQANIVRLLNIPLSVCDLSVRRARLLQRYSWPDHIRHLHCLYEELSASGGSSAEKFRL